MLWGYGQIAFPQKTLDVIKKYNLKGIVNYKPYISFETEKGKEIKSVHGYYYEGKVHFECLLWKHIDINGRCIIIDYSENDLGCKRCCCSKSYIGLSNYDIIYFEGLKNEELDIFSTIDNPTEIFVSQKFVDACKKENLTNILDRLVEVYDLSEYKK